MVKEKEYCPWSRGWWWRKRSATSRAWNGEAEGAALHAADPDTSPREVEEVVPRSRTGEGGGKEYRLETRLVLKEEVGLRAALGDGDDAGDAVPPGGRVAKKKPDGLGFSMETTYEPGR